MSQPYDIQINTVSSVGSSVPSSQDQKPISNKYQNNKMIDIQRTPESVTYRDIRIDAGPFQSRKADNMIDPDVNTFRS